MALMGNFETMSLAELFQWVGANRKTGTLKIGRGRLAIKIFFREGAIHGSSSNEPPSKLGQFLISRGKITEDILNRALTTQENETDRSLGSILVGTGAVTEEELERYCVAKAEEAIFGLLNLNDAHFEFDPEGQLDSTMVKMERDVQDLLLHGASHHDELERMRAVLRGPGVVLGRTELGLNRETASSSMARRIYDAIDGKRTFAEIILHTRASDYMATKFIYEMYRRGIVQIVEVRATTPQPGSPDAACELAQRMRERGDYEVALEILTAAARVEPNHAGLRQQLEATESAYLKALYETDCPPGAVPVALTGAPKSEGSEALSPNELYVRDLIEPGKWDVKSLVRVAPMYEIDVIRSIKGLVDKGFAEIRIAEKEEPASSEAFAEDLRNILRDIDAGATIEGSLKQTVGTDLPGGRDSDS